MRTRRRRYWRRKKEKIGKVRNGRGSVSEGVEGSGMEI